MIVDIYPLWHVRDEVFGMWIAPTRGETLTIDNWLWAGGFSCKTLKNDSQRYAYLLTNVYWWGGMIDCRSTIVQTTKKGVRGSTFHTTSHMRHKLVTVAVTVEHQWRLQSVSTRGRGVVNFLGVVDTSECKTDTQRDFGNWPWPGDDLLWAYIIKGRHRYCWSCCD